VFTVRYALSPYIKQIRSVFKGLIKLTDITQELGMLSCSSHSIVRDYLGLQTTVYDGSQRTSQPHKAHHIGLCLIHLTR
jgi:hypothetical protein